MISWILSLPPVIFDVDTRYVLHRIHNHFSFVLHADEWKVVTCEVTFRAEFGIQLISCGVAPAVLLHEEKTTHAAFSFSVQCVPLVSQLVGGVLHCFHICYI